MLEFNPSIGCGELPVGIGVVGISIILPGCDFVDEGLFIRESAFNKIRAFSRRCAGLLPFRISAASCSRSSPLNRTTYFFTIISFPAMIASIARVAAEANHQILSNWLKRPTSRPLPRIELISSRFIDLVSPIVDDGVAVDVVDSGDDPIFQLLFGRDADMTKSRSCEL